MTITSFGLEATQMLTSPLDIRARAHDASHFLLYPAAVAIPRDAADVARLLRGCREAGVSVTFRSGGTSLSGQAGTDGVLADVRRHFDGIEILDSGKRVRVEPGVTVNRVNDHLAPYGRRLGPDPASSAACTIGGVVANNSSGMACGTVENTYRTLESMVVVLASGTVVDTGATGSDDRLRLLEPELYQGLCELRDRVTSNPASVETITRLFSMKNTMGYALNAFTDFTHPIDMLTHLMIGSEGTLGFVASATFATLPVRSFVQTGLLVFEDLYAANRALPELVATGAATLELMDTASIRVGQALPGCAPQIAAIRPHHQAALLLEYQATNQPELDDLVAGARPTLDGLRLDQPVTLTGDAGQRDQLWGLRKGLYTAVASARRPGTTALLEDAVVPLPDLADTCNELTGLFGQFSYQDSVIFGHAKDGNIHFMITDDFGRHLDRYEQFTNAMVDVILARHGSLKAEHGTGRVMAPFVARQYGDELYDVMRHVKHLFDPDAILGDGVLITGDPRAHLKHIKTPASVDPLVDACVECGYCEPVCPSRNLTLTPRQRIVVQREIRAAADLGDAGLAETLSEAFAYSGRHTCAVDGMCATACPVGINTGVFIKQCRAEAASPTAQTVWKAAADHWAGATNAAGAALTAARDVRFAAALITAANEAARRAAGADNIPLWSKDLPRGGRSRRRPQPAAAPDAVYFPACVGTMFGGGVQTAFEALCTRAGLTLLVPDNIDSLCCGTPWTSKGMTNGRDAMASRVAAMARVASQDGRLPIVCDAASCTEGIQRTLQGEDLTVVDAVQYVAEHVLPKLPPLPKVGSITLHPTCSSTHIGLNQHLVTLAEAIAHTVHVPVDAGCCAFAGDRGLLHPELTCTATRPEAAEVALLDADLHASCNRTCEIGMSRATNRPYRHIIEVLAHQAALVG